MIPLRMAYVSWEYPPQYGGGIGTYVHTIARALAARGHQITVITIGDESYPTREQADGVEVIRLPQLHRPSAGALETLRAWQARADAVAETLQRLARGGAVELIEFCDFRGEGMTYLSTTTPGNRPVCVVRMHAPLCVLARYSGSAVRQPVLEEFEQEALRRADRLVCPSQVLVDEMRGVLGPQRTVERSVHPADALFLEDAADACGLEGDTALYVGRMQELKGVETLARAAAAFLDACPGAKLAMIGGDTAKGPGQPSMRQVVQSLIPRRLSSRVELLDAVPRASLLERYRAARLCVFPSHFENAPNTCLEAMALGCCVIGTSRTGMAEMIEDGASGVIVPPQDAAALSAALIRVWNLPTAQRRAMGNAARGRVRKLFHPDVVAADVEALYRGYVEASVFRAPPRILSRERAPRVAVVIPCFNHGRYVAAAVDSVRGQTYPNVDCTVVDDGSTERETLDELDRLRRAGVSVLRQDNLGLAAARNAGVRASAAAFFVPLDADDRIAPRFIEDLLPSLLDDPSCGYAYSHVTFFGDKAGEWKCPPYDPRRLLIENLSVATALVRRCAFDEVGGYSADMVHGFEDWDFWIALRAAGYGGVCVPRPLFFYRRHAGGSMLSKTERHRPEMVRRMIGHHRRLFAAVMEVPESGDGDGQALRLGEQATSAAESICDMRLDNDLYQSLLAKAELDYITNSNLWRAVETLQRRLFHPMGSGSRQGLPGDALDRDPRRRLARIKASNAYRLIQLIKSTSLYRWYGRRKYGPDFDQPPPQFADSRTQRA